MLVRAKKLRFLRLVAHARTLSHGLAWALATVLGAGLAPIAPGTCGTLVAIPLAFLLASGGRLVLGLGALAVFGIGTWASDVVSERSGREDDQRIVIDEVAGFLVTMVASNARAPIDLLLGFALFRVLDAWKPGLVRTIDRRVHGGLGVMLDDVAAGALGALVLVVIDRSGASSWLARVAFSG